MNLPEGYLLQDKKYRLTRPIGQGGFGITYLGVWNTEVVGELGKMKTRVPVCIKEYFFKDYCYRDKNSLAVKVHSITGEKLFSKFKEKLIEEAQILSAVHHPNIVNVLEVFEENNTAYIVMEYIKGNSLKYVLDNEGVLPEHKVIKYSHQIGNALTFVHEKNIVHLDIKPGNILIDQDDNALLIDFGVSKRYDIEEQETSTTTLTLSKGFAAIEQYDDEGMLNFSAAPDIYSLGATMYNLLTGVIPVESILRATKQMLPPSAYNSNISSKTEKAILKAMEIKPEHRFRSVNQLLAAIDAPVYDFTAKTSSDANRTDDEDQTEVISEHSSGKQDKDDEQTIVTTTSTTSSHKKRGKRRKALRRAVLAASILLVAFIGYGIYYYVFDEANRQGTTIKLPGDDLTSNRTDSIFTDEPGQTEQETVNETETAGQNGQNGQSGQSKPVDPPERNQQTQTSSPNPGGTASNNAASNNTASNNAASNNAENNTASNNTENSNLQNNDDVEPAAPTLTSAQRVNYEKDFNAFLQDGKTKMSNGGYEGALKDFQEVVKIGHTIGNDLTEANRLIDECNVKMNEQIVKERLANYRIIEKFGNYDYARRIDTKLFGVIDAAGKEIIPFEYVNSIELLNGHREFIKTNNRIDVWNKNGERVQQDLPPR